MSWIDIDTEHEVLEYHYPVGSAQIVELIGLVLASSPNSDHVVIWVNHSVDVVLETGTWFKGWVLKSRLEHVWRNVVASLHVYTLAINDKSELSTFEWNLDWPDAVINLPRV